MAILTSTKQERLLFSSTSLLILWIAFSCVKKDRANVQTTPFKALFILYEPFYGSQRKFSTDTIISQRVGFSSDVEFDSCKWTVGNDPRIWTQRTVEVTFLPSEYGQIIPVTFVAYWRGKTDTARKQIKVMGLKKFDDNVTPYTVDPAYIGKFSGSFQDEPSHRFDVTIVNFGPYPIQSNGAYYWDFRIFNLPEGCGGSTNNVNPCKVGTISPYHYAYTFQTTYKAFYVNTSDISTCCPPAVMYGYIDSVDHNKIVIEYNQLDVGGTHVDTVVKRKFVGYRQ